MRLYVATSLDRAARIVAHHTSAAKHMAKGVMRAAVPGWKMEESIHNNHKIMQTVTAA
jgi:hypothetical protein